jgi:soluble lytic murein transglycosylase-like protein
MLRMTVCCSAFAALAVAALAQPALASWPFDAGSGQSSGQATGRASRQVSSQVSNQVPAQASAYEAMVAQHASANGVPVSLVHRVIMRESRYDPRAVSAGNYGLMQIRLGTARAMGYGGSAVGLLDAETNMTYAVRYLAGAYRAAGGNEARAVALYARGY